MNLGLVILNLKNFVFSDSKEQLEILNVTTISHDSSFKEIPNDVDSHNIVNILESKVVVNISTWTLYFDGSKSKEGAGASCLLIDPKGNKTCIACRLEFNCTNNTVEYEALIQGLKKAIDLDIKVLVAYGDSEIIVRQVRNSIHCISEHLQNYQQEVWNLISHFDAFNIMSVPRFQNQEAYLLANVASKLIPFENFTPYFFSVELIFRPSIPDNIFNWHVFNNDL